MGCGQSQNRSVFSNVYRRGLKAQRYRSDRTESDRMDRHRRLGCTGTLKHKVTAVIDGKEKEFSSPVDDCRNMIGNDRRSGQRTIYVGATGSARRNHAVQWKHRRPDA